MYGLTLIAGVGAFFVWPLSAAAIALQNVGLDPWAPAADSVERLYAFAIVYLAAAVGQTLAAFRAWRAARWARVYGIVVSTVLVVSLAYVALRIGEREPELWVAITFGLIPYIVAYGYVAIAFAFRWSPRARAPGPAGSVGEIGAGG